MASNKYVSLRTLCTCVYLCVCVCAFIFVWVWIVYLTYASHTLYCEWNRYHTCIAGTSIICKCSCSDYPQKSQKHLLYSCRYYRRVWKYLHGDSLVSFGSVIILTHADCIVRNTLIHTCTYIHIHIHRIALWRNIGESLEKFTFDSGFCDLTTKVRVNEDLVRIHYTRWISLCGMSVQNQIWSRWNDKGRDRESITYVYIVATNMPGRTVFEWL